MTTTYTCGVCKNPVEVTNEDQAAVTHNYLGRRCPGSWVTAIATTYQAAELVELDNLVDAISQLQARLKQRCIALLHDYPGTEIARRAGVTRQTVARWERESLR